MVKDTVLARTVGRRKTAVARVTLKPGAGTFEVNGRSHKDYFHNERLITEVERPLKVTEKLGQMLVRARLTGGGKSGQAGALKLGLARALLKADPAARAVLRKEGLLTRDARIVERKKYGLHGARRGTQFSKR